MPNTNWFLFSVEMKENFFEIVVLSADGTHLSDAAITGCLSIALTGVTADRLAFSMKHSFSSLIVGV